MTRATVDSSARGRGFTLIELLVVIAIIGLLLGILLPSLAKVQQAGWRVACASNARQQVVALNMYANDNNERLPIARVGPWETTRPLNSGTPYIQDVLIPYVGGVFGDGNYSDVFRCPAIDRGQGRANEEFQGGFLLSDRLQNCYRYNTWEAIEYPRPPISRDHVWRGKKIGTALFPDQAALIFDMVFPDWDREDLPHGDGSAAINVGYLDGHANAISAETYFELNPDSDRERDNPFITRGWRTAP